MAAVFRKSWYCPNEIANTRYESHREFADLHVVISGSEVIRTVFTADALPAVPYAEKDDGEFFTADSNISDKSPCPGQVPLPLPVRAPPARVRVRKN